MIFVIDETLCPSEERDRSDDESLSSLEALISSPEQITRRDDEKPA